MPHDPLTQVLALLLAAVLVVALARRVGLPPVLGYLVVGILVGPYVLGILDDPGRTQLLAEIGVVFLLFTLGLEFSWPRMVAMRREVFGLGLAQVLITMALFVGIGRWLGLSWLVSLVIGGALSMSSTAIVIRQLTEQAEINRTHGRLTFAILLFQDLAFVPLLALANALSEDTPTRFDLGTIVKAVVSGFIALLLGAAGRPLPAATAVHGDGAQPPEGAVHAGGAVRGAGGGLGHRACGPVAGPSAVFSPACCSPRPNTVIRWRR